jgi:hypothetical protein
VEEVSLASFAQGRAIWVRAHGEPRFDGTEVTRRARSRLGEDRYRVFSNNCEHFCEWCLRDQHRSDQIENLLALPRRLARVCSNAIAGLFAGVARTLGRAIPELAPFSQPHHMMVSLATHELMARRPAPE